MSELVVPGILTHELMVPGTTNSWFKSDKLKASIWKDTGFLLYAFANVLNLEIVKIYFFDKVLCLKTCFVD